ncbi:hypothetical protein OKJ48_23040 [Streptomyces kunmingensis]|uniref:Lipoprotein CseA n=1 Tax=Streptomyces kunmingensis TaxID=68225 RepID=A0ABU6CEH0_9ACTN|nr:hypothetical protein [Streptomyces kunmingensis]MEB3963101.1 hypothetical protein [Streptomyces kunmingensis]
MRVLRVPGVLRVSGVLRAGGSAVAGLAAVGVFLGALVACSAGGTGARDEGPARTDPVGSTEPAASATASPSRIPKTVDAVRLVKADPEVSSDIKRDLKPCVADEYPVDVSYGNLTGGASNDVVVNVMTCGDAVGIGTYVYRDEGGNYRNVFRTEEPPVYAEIDRGDLVVTKQVYEKGDSVASPSGEEILTYRWSGGRFAQASRTHNDYSNAVDGESPAPTDDG